MITKMSLKKKITEAGEDGIWVGFIRNTYDNGETLVDELLDSGKFEKVKSDSPLEKPVTRSGMVWAIRKVKK